MRIVITEKGYLSTLPKIQRPVMLHKIFDLASEKGWTVSVAGQHWDA